MLGFYIAGRLTQWSEPTSRFYHLAVWSFSGIHHGKEIARLNLFLLVTGWLSVCWASQGVFRICFKETERSSQSQGPSHTCSGCSYCPAWSTPFRDDTTEVEAATTNGELKHRGPSTRRWITVSALGGTEGSSQCQGLRSSCTGWTRRPVRPGPVASEMTPTTGAANVVTPGRSSHVLLSSTSPFRCVLYALGRLRAALSSRESVKAAGDRALQARLATVVSIITERHWFLDCTSMIAAIFSSVQEIAHVTEIIQETCSFTLE